MGRNAVRSRAALLLARRLLLLARTLRLYIASPTQRRQNDPLAKGVTREVIAIALQGGTAHAAPAGEFAAWRAAYTGTRSPADGALALRVKALKDRRR